ncbi:MAG: hypothetical protein ACYDHZ_00960 [Dehalococcoidia bacterium]
MQVAVEYKLSEAYLREQVIATGKKPEETAKAEIDLEPLTPEEREVVVRAQDYELLHYYHHVLGALKIDSNTGDITIGYPRNTYRPLGTPEILAELRRMVGEYEALLPEQKRIKTERKAQRDEAERQTAAYRELNRRHDEKREADRQAAAAARDVEKQKWITAHGSAHLRLAVSRGYDCQTLYVTERVATEIGEGWEIRTSAEWKSRSCPSATALTLEVELEAKGITAAVVWLTDDGENHDEPFEACEAVVIEDYLGQYTLIKVS